MPARDSLARQITTSAQLLVEGRTPEIFFREMVDRLSLSRIEVRDFESIENLTLYLRTFVGLPGFAESVRRLGVIRDAETGPATDALASVRVSLQAAGLSAPDQLAQLTTGPVRTGVFILPNCRDTGMLETLCVEAAAHRQSGFATLQCVDSYFECIQSSGIALPRNMAKAKAWAFLAAQEVTDPLIGRAAQANIWPWDCPAFAQLRTFLEGLNAEA